MKRMAVILILIIAAASVIAGERGMRPRINVTEALNLSAEQATAWENAERSFHTALQPLLEQHTALRKQLEQSLAAKADACTIGAQEQQAWAVGEQIKSAYLSFEQQRESILTPAQKAKYDALHQEGETHEMRRKLEF